MSERTLASGTQMFFGVPANPMPSMVVDAIGQTVAQVRGIREAYLPQCYIEGDDAARQVLVVGVERGSEIPDVMQQLLPLMKLVLPSGQFVDILPFQSIPADARIAECQVFAAPDKSPWWKFW